ncbi:T9SS type A sorting domain-containing protein [Winogradskyella sp.]|uniref:T9SS type A sorting domain-containing protein n=1 Tax=Winogradskyella sp. TaxID=1883156 RepID=UPI0025F94DEA|nr:T9SS type A sorting domain-containing protein [Winogradskyella sp.]
MKPNVSKNLIGSLLSFIHSNSIKTALIIFSSLLLYNAAPLLDDTPISSHYGHLKLNINTSSLSYFTEFYFNSNASVGLDPGYDAAMFGGNTPSFSIYSHLVQNSIGTDFAVQALSHTDMNDVTIPIGVNANQGQEVTFSITQSDVPQSIDIYLEDRFNNTFTLLNTNDYNFTADVNLSGTGRFYLKFEGDALSTNEQPLEELHIYADAYNKAIVINGQLLSSTNFKLYDIHGRLVRTKELDITSSNQIIDTSQLSTDIYILELIDNNNQRRVQKVVLK